MPDSPKKSHPSKTWMLFEDGDAAEVNVTLHPSTDKSRPINAYIVTEGESELIKSARPSIL